MNKYANFYEDLKDKKRVNRSTNKAIVSYNHGPKVEMFGPKDGNYDVEFYDAKEMKLLFKTTIANNHWAKASKNYFVNWLVIVREDGKIIREDVFDPTGKNVRIYFDSRALGDTLAWIPYAEEFRKKWNCVVYVSTFNNDFIRASYPELHFLDYAQLKDDIYCSFKIGFYLEDTDLNLHPSDPKGEPLQKIAADVLGLDYQEIRPNIKLKDNKSPFERKYVTIATKSTANAKHWHNPYGWQEVVNHLKSRGYEVVHMSKEGTDLQGVIRAEDLSIDDAARWIKNSEFFIGLGSGLSWLAWSLGKKVLMISGFSMKFCEFTQDCYRVINESVCHGCFNTHIFDRGDWNWCPVNKNTPKQFECTKKISSERVLEEIEKIIGQ